MSNLNLSETSVNQSVDDVVDDIINEGDLISPEQPLEFPCSFSKRNGVVLLRGAENQPIVHYKKGLTPAIANEVNRFLKEKVWKQFFISNRYIYLLQGNTMENFRVKINSLPPTAAGCYDCRYMQG